MAVCDISTDHTICKRYWSASFRDLLFEMAYNEAADAATIWDVVIDCDHETDRWYGRIYRMDLGKALTKETPDEA